MKVELESYSTFFYVALTLLMSKGEKTIFPDALYILDPNQIIQLMDMLGGQTIRIPTRKEFANELQIALAIYYLYVEGKTQLMTEELLNIDGNKMRGMKQRIDSYFNFIKKEGLIPPSFFSGVIDVRQS